MGVRNSKLSVLISKVLVAGIHIGSMPVNAYAYENVELIGNDAEIMQEQSVVDTEDILADTVIEQSEDILVDSEALQEKLIEEDLYEENPADTDASMEADGNQQTVDTSAASADEMVDEGVAWIEDDSVCDMAGAEAIDGATPKINLAIDEGNVLVGVKGTYYTETAEKIRTRINQIRYEACSEGLKDPATGKKLTVADYQPIFWSADMEAIARQRAAEASIRIAHERPNKKTCFSVKTTDGIGSYAESLAWNYEGVMRGIEQWYAEKSDYVNNTGKTTGHYEHLISTGYTYTGIGCFRNYTGGWYCIAQESCKSTVSMNNAKDSSHGAATALVEYDKSYVKSLSLKDKPDLIYLGEKGKLTLNTKVVLNNGANGDKAIEGEVREGGSFTSSNPAILTVSVNGELQADKTNEGDVTITATAGGSKVSAVISVVDPNRNLSYTITYDMLGHGLAPTAEEYTRVIAGGRLMEPECAEVNGYQLVGWYRDADCTKQWNFATDVVNEDMTLYAGWVKEEAGNFFISDIQDRYYTGSAIKPSVIVRNKTTGAILRAGKDYTIRHINNVVAYTGTDTEKRAAVIVTGKGNYKDTKTIYYNIRPAIIADVLGYEEEGFSVKCNETLTIANKAQSVFTSIKYKKTMTRDKDYSVKLTTLDAKDSGGGAIASGMELTDLKIPAGYSGSFRLNITGSGNYTGTITKTISVVEKAKRLDAAKVTLGKKQKSIDFSSGSRTLTPGIYNPTDGHYYTVSESGVSTEPEKNADNIFTVKCGNNYLVAGRDYMISYDNDDVIGNATMYLVGIGDYRGVKKISYKIVGRTISAKAVAISNVPSEIEYSGKANAVNNAVLLYRNKNTGNSVMLPGRDYTISYKNNVNAGKMTVVFTGLATGGYRGSIKRTIKITPVNISDSSKVKVNTALLNGQVEFVKAGAAPSTEDIFTLSGNAETLVEGKDYTVSCKNNKQLGSADSAKAPLMEVKGKGNYKGVYSFKYSVVSKSISSNDITVNIAAINYSAKKADTYVYKPAVKLKDRKSSMNGSTEYSVRYVNCNQSAVRNYLGRIVSGDTVYSIPWSETPHVEISAKSSKGYSGIIGGRGDEYDRSTCAVPVVADKLTTSNAYVVVDTAYYSGSQVTPAIRVYYTQNKNILKEMKKYSNHEEIMTAGGSEAVYLTGMLDSGREVYAVAYGENINAGKNKGLVTISGKSPYYGGKISVKFTINAAAIDKSVR